MIVEILQNSQLSGSKRSLLPHVCMIYVGPSLTKTHKQYSRDKSYLFPTFRIFSTKTTFPSNYPIPYHPSRSFHPHAFGFSLCKQSFT